jgi:late competence protein required for DNA uptake (superfamily II DNA/RNA helicase)
MNCSRCKFLITSTPGLVLPSGKQVCQSCVVMEGIERLDNHYAKREGDQSRRELEKEDMEGFDIAIDQE